MVVIKTTMLLRTAVQSEPAFVMATAMKARCEQAAAPMSETEKSVVATNVETTFTIVATYLVRT